MSNHQFNKHAGINEDSEERDHVSICIENMLSGVPPTSPKHTIFKVRHQLREVNKKAYDPEILAIGPFHYGNDKFKFMEEQKLRYLKQLLMRKGESVHKYMRALRKLERRARRCYAETSELSQECFLAMMLIDGCFIIELFRKHCVGELRDENDPVMHDWGIRNRIGRDLLLLENQLPLFVLSKLYDLINKGPGEDDKFIDVAAKYLKAPSRSWEIVDRPDHLLHLYHTWYTSGLPQRRQRECIPVMPSATELRESGIRFRAAQGRELSHIKFENGTLEIPVFYVEDDTESKYRNLIAYEQHRQSRDINYFTDYVKFMDCLINSSKDVEMLRRAGIIENYLGNDKVVAWMFNKMCNNVPVCDSYYHKIFQNVKTHCEKRRNIWMANLRREYFHSPWAFLSVLAALTLLLLTVAQTVFTILSHTKSS